MLGVRHLLFALALAVVIIVALELLPRPSSFAPTTQAATAVRVALEPHGGGKSACSSSHKRLEPFLARAQRNIDRRWTEQGGSFAPSLRLPSRYRAGDGESDAVGAWVAGGLAPLESFLRRRVIEERSNNRHQRFVIAAMGDSIPAAHDNLGHEAYYSVFAQILTPIFASLGIALEVRNQALGNAFTYPSTYCIAQQAGRDVDLLFWDFAMHGGTASDVEDFIRFAVELPRRPLVVVVDSAHSAFPDVPVHNTRAFATHLSARRAERLVALRKKLQVYEDRGLAVFLDLPSALKTDRLSDLLVPFSVTADDDPLILGLELPKLTKSSSPLSFFRFPKHGATRADWHPGARAHELYGHVLATMMIAALRYASECSPPPPPPGPGRATSSRTDDTSLPPCTRSVVKVVKKNIAGSRRFERITPCHATSPLFCAVVAEPHVAGASLASLLDNQSNAVNTTSWKTMPRTATFRREKCKGMSNAPVELGFLPLEGHGIFSKRAVSKAPRDDTQWHKLIDINAEHAVSRGIALGAKLRDVKWGWVGTKSARPLPLLLPVTTTKLLLCGYHERGGEGKRQQRLWKGMVGVKKPLLGALSVVVDGGAGGATLLSTATPGEVNETALALLGVNAATRVQLAAIVARTAQRNCALWVLEPSILSKQTQPKRRRVEVAVTTRGAFVVLNYAIGWR